MFLANLNRRWAKLQFTEDARLRLYRKMSKLLSNGLPLLRILEELYDRASQNGEKPDEAIAIVLADWRLSVQNGRMLGEAMAGWIPDAEQMIILAGEQSGRLEHALLAVIDVVQSAKRIKGAVLGGIAYPIAILVLILIYIYIFGTRVIPQFAVLVDPANWQGTARSLHVMSVFVQNWMLYLVAGLLAVAALVFWSLPNWHGRLRQYVDKIPPYSIYRLTIGSSFLMAFSALQAAGITVEKSLQRLSEFASPWLAERLDGTLLGIKSGLNCGEAMRNTGYDFPSKEIVDDLCVYAEYKGFDEALKTLADEWLEEGVETIGMQMKLLNGLSIVLLASVIAWLVIGFFGIQQEIASMTRSMR